MHLTKSELAKLLNAILSFEQGLVCCNLLCSHPNHTSNSAHFKQSARDEVLCLSYNPRNCNAALRSNVYVLHPHLHTVAIMYCDGVRFRSSFIVRELSFSFGKMTVNKSDSNNFDVFTQSFSVYST